MPSSGITRLSVLYTLADDLGILTTLVVGCLSPILLVIHMKASTNVTLSFKAMFTDVSWNELFSVFACQCNKLPVQFGFHL